MSIHASGQDIFNTVLEDSKKIMNDSTNNIVAIKIARFKYTDLQYIKKKAFEKEGDVTKDFMDNQAYYMTEFLSTFFKAVILNTDLKKSEKKDLILLFIDASSSNSLFNDTDKELVNAYIDDSKNQITPFCLDTDWPKAYAAVMSKLQQGK